MNAMEKIPHTGDTNSLDVLTLAGLQQIRQLTTHSSQRTNGITLEIFSFRLSVSSCHVPMSHIFEIKDIIKKK